MKRRWSCIRQVLCIERGIIARGLIECCATISHIAANKQRRCYSNPVSLQSFEKPGQHVKRIAVGISGGVDSAVAALLLKHAGYDIFGVFMRNWDEAEERGNRNCSVEKDLRDAKAVCSRLGIPLHEIDFVSRYWTDVFEGFISDCARGLTPNPDLSCNRHIKFGALLDFSRGLGADAVATGHYARIRQAANGTVQLMKGADTTKDQSYFLASVHTEALRHVVFPLGGHTKSKVRELAKEAALVPAEKRSSAGICFIGRRNFANFLSEYVPPKPGRYLDAVSGEDLGPCDDVLKLTHGQRAGIGGKLERTYVVGKDVRRTVVYVAMGRGNSALLTKSACVGPPHWLSAVHENILRRDGYLRCEFTARYREKSRPCSLHLVSTPAQAAAFEASSFCGMHAADAAVFPGCMLAVFDEPAIAITPGQIFVMYDGDMCLGSAPIVAPGKTVFELDNCEVSV